jgi:hypothetical protein
VTDCRNVGHTINITSMHTLHRAFFEDIFFAYEQSLEIVLDVYAATFTPYFAAHGRTFM